MTKLEPRRVAALFGSFLVVAFVINSIRQREGTREGPIIPHPPRPALQESVTPKISEPPVKAPASVTSPTATTETVPPTARIKSHEEIEAERAAEKARYLSRYLNRKPEREAGIQSIAIAVLGENGKWNSSLERTLARRFAGTEVKVLTSLLTPNFAAEGLFNELFNSGSPSLLSKLELGGTLDAMLLAKQTVEYSSNPSLENVLTASMRLELASLRLDKSGESHTWTFNATGAGFKQSDARELAEERLVKQIETETNKMNLADFVLSRSP